MQILIVSIGVLGAGVALSTVAFMIPGDQLAMSFSGGALIGLGLTALIRFLVEW